VPLVKFLVLALATWRISSLVSEEDGPWAVLAKLRHVLGVRYDEHNWPYGENEIAETLICMWCVTPWIGLIWALFYLLVPDVAFYVAMPFALSAAAILINARGVRFRKRS